MAEAAHGRLRAAGLAAVADVDGRGAADPLIVQRAQTFHVLASCPLGAGDPIDELDA